MTTGKNGRAGKHERDADHEAGPRQRARQLARAQSDRGTDRPEHEHEARRRHSANRESATDSVGAPACAVLGADAARQVGGQERETARVDGGDGAGDEGEADRAAGHPGRPASRSNASRSQRSSG